jgi:MFS family permease
MPLGAVGGALLLSPVNEALGRRMAIIVACILYMIGAVSYGMMIPGRLVLGFGLGLDYGTVPVYVAECVARKYMGNLMSFYQFNIALVEVFGYVDAAIFVNVRSANQRFMLGSPLAFSTIMLAGMLFMQENPRFLMHKGRAVDAYGV